MEENKEKEESKKDNLDEELKKLGKEFAEKNKQGNPPEFPQGTSPPSEYLQNILSNFMDGNLTNIDFLIFRSQIIPPFLNFCIKNKLHPGFILEELINYFLENYGKTLTIKIEDRRDPGEVKEVVDDEDLTWRINLNNPQDFNDKMLRIKGLRPDEVGAQELPKCTVCKKDIVGKIYHLVNGRDTVEVCARCFLERAI